MVHGGPDWGTGGEVKTIYTIEDLGELAARLGSIVTFDRRGNVMFADGFEDGIQNWSRGGTGTEVIEWNSQYSKDGGFSCKLETDVNANDSAGITKHIGYPALSSIGLELSISDKQNWKSLVIELLFQISAGQYQARITYDYATLELYYLSAAGDNIAIPGSFYMTQMWPYYFDTIKLVVDFVNSEYVRLTVNAITYDLSGIALRYMAGAASPWLHSLITLYGDGTGAAIAYVDSVIITQNEP